jgi:pSer/pThr/pTyr-binding forkhead associated (FHA) protein
VLVLSLPLLSFNFCYYLQSSAVDRQHAVIDIDELGESYVLQDLNTTYGTYVNDCRIDNAAIKLFSGDIIRFGNSNILYEFVSSSEPTVSK